MSAVEAARSLMELADLSPAALPRRLALPSPANDARPQTPPALTLAPPGSKSLTNRGLLLAALAHGPCELRGALTDADDAQVMVRALRALGVGVDISNDDASNSRVGVRPVGGAWHVAPGATVRLDLHNAGTATRFLTAGALLAPRGASIVIDGNARMRQRPIGELARALRELGASVEALGAPDCPPLRVSVGGANGDSGQARLGDSIAFRHTASSQFISALMLVAPFLARGLTIDLEPPHTSIAYVRMTALFMTRAFGVAVDSPWARDARWRPAPGEPARVRIGAQRVVPASVVEIEPDASGAAPLLAAGVLARAGAGAVRVEGIVPTAHGGTQGDADFFEVLRAFGGDVEHRVDAGRHALVARPSTIRGAEVDLSAMPDTAMVAAFVAAFAAPTPENPSGASVLRGLRTLRVKETDRIAALQAELAKIGAQAEVFSHQAEDGAPDEGLRITPRATSATSAPTGDFVTYDDHRMAMSAALASLRVPGVVIDDPACVAKTYPGFWEHFRRLASR
jgi:3-phosphoshikimate 1-carboxyvinyltransferase